jgi:ElaB/YqjD/DUF883 family membrane-anchored ribosome-binding protein
MRIEAKPITEILARAVNDFGDKHFRYYHLQKHFENHVEAIIDSQTKSSKLRDEVVKENIKKDIAIARRLTKNLDMVAQQIDEIAERLDNPVEQEMFLKFIAESRMIVEQLLKWGSKLNLEESSEDLMKKIMDCLRDFPPDLIQKFIDRWEEHER